MNPDIRWVIDSVFELEKMGKLRELQLAIDNLLERHNAYMLNPAYTFSQALSIACDTVTRKSEQDYRRIFGTIRGSTVYWLAILNLRFPNLRIVDSKHEGKRSIKKLKALVENNANEVEVGKYLFTSKF